jgi:hypothetical protein
MMLAYYVGMARGWHRAGFRLCWRWKSRPRDGRPTVPLEIRPLIREMSTANPRWGRECRDQVVVFGERHLRHVPLSYMKEEL